MKLTLVEHSLRQFGYTAADKTIVADASDLNNRHLERLYDDAMDVGFAVKSETTGNVVVFVMTETFYYGCDEDREIAGWKYTPTSECLRTCSEAVGLKATIFND